MKQVVWITGASSGIGRALALQYAERGATLILTSRRMPVLEEVKHECLEAGSPDVHVQILDMTNGDDILSVADEICQKYPSLNTLINNAGISQRSVVTETSMEVYRQLMEVDFFGPVQLTKALLPHLIRQKKSRIVVISSLVGKFSTALRSGYSAAKHALHGFFDALRLEHDPKSLSVIMICPGFIHTDISVNALTAKGEKYNKMDETQENGMSAETFAIKALKAIESDTREVTIGGSETLGVLLFRLFPNFFTNYLRKNQPRTPKS